MRWSYSTYLNYEQKKTESIIAKLDSSLLGKNKEESTERIKEYTIEKLQLSNYTEHVNVFFEKLFALPEKLKKYEKAKRNDKLREYLNKITKKFLSHKADYLDGISFPISLDSSVAVNILVDQCFTFSTKERVPFKLVIETISFEDSFKIKRCQQPNYKQ